MARFADVRRANRHAVKTVNGGEAALRRALTLYSTGSQGNHEGTFTLHMYPGDLVQWVENEDHFTVTATDEDGYTFSTLIPSNDILNPVS